MSKRIITIGRQFGSGGHEIAEHLSQKLGIPLYDREIVETAAERLKIDEAQLESVDEKALNNFVMSYQRMFGVDMRYRLEGYNESLSDQIYKEQALIIKELANQGPGIFVGRCADDILRKRDDVLSVFICADKADRVERIIRVRNVVREYAEQLIKDTDKKRRNYYKAYTGKGWEDVANYHMILNASRLGLEGTVDMLVKLYEM